MPRRATLRDKIERQIARKKGDDVFLTREFRKLGGEDQVLRALRALVKDGRLVRLGYGVYCRAEASSVNGQGACSDREGFLGVAHQALDKLGVTWEPTKAQRVYNEGRATHASLNPVVHAKGRFSRQLRYRDMELVRPQKTSRLVEPIAESLRPYSEGITAAFVFGSMAKGTHHADSDVDLMVVGENLDYADLYPALMNAELKLHRKVEPLFMSPDDWKRKRGEKDSFVQKIGGQPKVFVIGSENELRR